MQALLPMTVVEIKKKRDFTEEFEYLGKLALANRDEINSLSDDDHEAIRQMLLSSESLEPELVFVEPENDKRRSGQSYQKA